MSLRSLAREAPAQMLRWSGAPWLLRRATRRNAAILLYHDPSPAVMDAHLAWLRERYAFTTLDAVVDAIARGDASALPERALVVTLDDGHRGNHALLPVFRRHGVVPTIYLCTQVVGTARRFWFQQPGRDVQPYKRLRNEERIAALARECGFAPERAYPPEERQALCDAEIAEMAPWVDFQPHTRFHPVLTQCSDDEAWREIAGSKRELEERLGRPCRHFSYPNGDYREREVEMARRAGYASARTIDLGWARAGGDLFRLPCFGIADDATIPMLVAQLSGIPGYVRRRLQGQRGGRWPVTQPAA
ncbi:MAG: polysaccharide deacetylase [Proteobacteria bacterium]|nr:MAG: polysaccharide deacetylase [Pseudomonadota bacterium]